MTLQPTWPWWLIALLFLPPLTGLIVLAIRQWKQPKKRWIWLRRAMLIALLLVTVLRPATPGASRATGNALLDVYFLVDTTVSATAEDYNGNRPRLEGMSHDVKQIAKELVGARFSIISFDDQAVQHLPLTHDTTTLASAVDTLSTQEPFYAEGSSIDAGLDTLKKELERIADKAPHRGRVIFYMGDGEQTVDREPRSFRDLKPLVKGGAVLGYGTAAGGKMADEDKRRWGDDKHAYIKDRSTQTYPQPDAISKLSESNLRAIADQAGLAYVHRTEPGDAKAVTSAIDVGEIIKRSDETTAYEDWYWVATPIIVALLSVELWQLWAVAHSLKTARKGGVS